ncbi:twin-arginine translocase subunit TatC [Flavobacterium macacae]|uniref:Sec-independent protein translocase protein TatC n=1 Tax=Flavobacterium macacae TaxID=2488993 RepID=A0A3P3WBR1_9FLAO|nr:twin-arginine translocase subunit TatC [Flavobacterium macacae]RRJ92605.1 twin-arginine translocase subunit TatC [Flavobacterium macacae]
MAKKNTNEMSFLDHLEDLRWLLIRCTLAIMIAAAVAFFFVDYIFDNILFAPRDPNFITYQWFCEASKFFGAAGEGFCDIKMDFTIQSRVMSGQFNAHIWTAITAGFILAFPVILWELWKFIRPALYDKERKGAKLFIFISSVLFFVGVLFGYYIITPLSINFLANYQVSAQIHNDIDLDSYISLIRSTTLSCGLVFELPVIMFFLSKLGLVTPTFLRTYRKYAIVIILILAAIVTPPDVVSQITVSIPLLILYECSIFISGWVLKTKQKNEQLS